MKVKLWQIKAWHVFKPCVKFGLAKTSLNQGYVKCQNKYGMVENGLMLDILY